MLFIRKNQERILKIGIKLKANIDKSWMTMGKTPDGRLSHPYIEGVNAFINFT